MSNSAPRSSRSANASALASPGTSAVTGATGSRVSSSAFRQEVARLQSTIDTLQGQNAALRQLVSIYDRLGNLVLQGAGSGTITAVLGDLIGRRVLLLDPLMRPVDSPDLVRRDAEPPSAGPWTPNEAYVSRVLGMMSGESRPLRIPAIPPWGVALACVLAPIVIREATVGFLAILEDGPEGEELDLLAAQHAASVYALSMLRERIASELSERLRGELLDSLLLGEISDEPGATQRGQRLGLQPDCSYHVVTFAPQDTATAVGPRSTNWEQTRRRHVLDGVARVLGTTAPGAIVNIRQDELVALVPAALAGHGEPITQLAGEAALRHVAAFFPSWTLTVGIGGPFREAVEISQSYQQSKRAVETALRFGRRGQLINFDTLGLYRLLFHVHDHAELRAFVKQTLGAVIDYDRKHQAEFVKTLAAYLHNHESLQASARDLSVHVNTVTYRIHRIQDITGLVLDRAEDRLLAQVALKILEGGNLK